MKTMEPYMPLITVFVSGLFGLAVVVTTTIAKERQRKSAIQAWLSSGVLTFPTKIARKRCFRTFAERLSS